MKSILHTHKLLIKIKALVRKLRKGYVQAQNQIIFTLKCLLTSLILTQYLRSLLF